MRHDRIMIFFFFKVLLTEHKEVFRRLQAEFRGRLLLPSPTQARPTQPPPHLLSLHPRLGSSPGLFPPTWGLW